MAALWHNIMDKASDFESEDCEFESRQGRIFSSWITNDVYKCVGLIQ